MNDLEFRAATVADVSYPKRTATVIVAPYETPTVINTRAGSFTEIVSRGAYAGVQRRGGSIRANRDHDWGKVAGKVEALYPDREEGLVAEVRMFTSPLGEETLTLCAEGGLSLSAGFALMREQGASGPVKRGAETWEQNRKVRRLNDLWLDHVSFVGNPAYETATVLDVRHDEHPVAVPVGTPNLDQLDLERWRAKLVAIDNRYIV
jgi:phage head maturation protease